MEIEREFLKGSISLLLLNLLSRGEMYGYEILQKASRRSASAIEFKEGTLYPALHNSKRSVISRMAHSRKRKGAQVLPAHLEGEKVAREYEKQWQHLTGAIAAVLASK